MNSSDIQAIINNYRKSLPQSEAEVRSKWIVPLLETLGYPSEHRAEEFPVFGYDGSKELKAKFADFLLFTDKDFGSHKKNSQEDKEWVENHSLLVVEAKKPGNISDDMGQAKFYNYWSKAVAYIMTDGEDLRGFFYNPVASDIDMIDSKVDDLAYLEQLWNFTYEHLLSIKTCSLEEKLKYPFDEDVHFITSDKQLMLPESVLNTMRETLGKNSVGRSNVEVVSMFLSITESLLNNGLRYDIPEYIIDFPRNDYDSQLFVDSSPGPVMGGKTTEYYWENIDRYVFESKSLDLFIELLNGKISQFGVGVHVLDDTVNERIESFKVIKRIFDANYLYIRISSDKTIHISLDDVDRNRKKREQSIALHDVWVESLRKLKCIEEYYQIEFALDYIEEQEELEYFYNTLEFIYAGTRMEQNCSLIGSKKFEIKDAPVIEEPILIDEIPDDRAKEYTLHGVTFKTYRHYMLPGIIRAKGKHNNKRIEIPICCECKVVDC